MHLFHKRNSGVRIATGVLMSVLLLLPTLAADVAPLVGSASLLRGQLAQTTIGTGIRSGCALGEDDAALRLYYLDMLTGTGTGKDGSVTFDLQRDLTRLEGAVMAVRLMGMEDAVLSGTYSHPFSDVPEWASGYVGYLYSCGLIEAGTEGKFSPQSPASVEYFMGCMLYALGFRMREGDYNFLTVADQARYAGLCVTDEDEPLTRGDAAVAMYNTLRANVKGSTKMLSEVQVADGRLAYTDAVFLLWCNNKAETKTYLDAVGYSAEWIVPDGYYTIRMNGDLVMNVLADGPNRDYEGLGVCTWQSTGDISQSYRLERTERGTYLVYAACSRGGFYRLLGCANTGSNIGVYQATSRNALEFTIRHSDDGTWQFVTRDKNGAERYLTGGSAGSSLQLTADGATAWTLERLGITNSAGQDLALFPADSMRVTQGAYDDFSHMEQNALDIQPTGGMAFAPFNAQIVRKDAGAVLCNGIWIQSTDKVRYADGSYDYMTVLFMHDDNIDNLSVGQMLTQGEYFYQSGTTGNSSGAHIHVAAYRGQYNEEMRFGSGDVDVEDAFFVMDDTIIHEDYDLAWVFVSDVE